MHVFEVLDEEVFEIAAPFIAICLYVGLGDSFLIHQGFDQIALGLVHGNYANGAVGPLAHQRGSFRDDGTRFFKIAALPDLVGAIDFPAGDAKLRVLHHGAWIDEQALAVELAVGIGY